jgi:hypothetical protein
MARADTQTDSMLEVSLQAQVLLARLCSGSEANPAKVRPRDDRQTYGVEPPAWPAYEVEQRETMILAGKPNVESDPLQQDQLLQNVSLDLANVRLADREQAGTRLYSIVAVKRTLEPRNVKRLYTFDVGDNVRLVLLKSQLEARSIPCLTRGEHMASAAGGVPFGECNLELWVLNDEDFEAAKTALKRWLAPVDRAAWDCENCGETIEGQFQLCWNCGNARPE